MWYSQNIKKCRYLLLFIYFIILRVTVDACDLWMWSCVASQERVGNWNFRTSILFVHLMFFFFFHLKSLSKFSKHCAVWRVATSCVPPIIINLSRHVALIFFSWRGRDLPRVETETPGVAQCNTFNLQIWFIILDWSFLPFVIVACYNVICVNYSDWVTSLREFAIPGVSAKVWGWVNSVWWTSLNFHKGWSITQDKV